MALFALPFVLAFAVPPISIRRRNPSSEKASGLPLAFAIFCLVCAALSLAEVLWPPFAAGVAAVDSLMPRL